VIIGGTTIDGLHACYAAVPPGEPVALIGSHGRLEIAVNQGSAADRLQAKVGGPVHVSWGLQP
jgi:hypothetical protein